MEELKYPRGEHVWVGYYNRAGELLFIITSKEARDWYYLYKLENGTFKKLGKAHDPSELVSRYSVEHAMRG